MSRTKNLPATPRRKRRSPPVRIRVKGIQGNLATFGSPGPAEKVWRKQLETALGSVSPDFLHMCLHHLERAARMPGAGPSDMAINGAIAMIVARAPRDEAEAVLAVQMAATHMISMVLMARIGGGHGTDRRLPALASASAKLMRAHCMQVETYRRMRGGGEQNIRVEHVHVHEGGQAIVGAVNQQVPVKP